MSKAAQSLSSAPASIYVITHEEIRRSGVLSDSGGAAARAEPAGRADQFAGIPDRARGFGSHLEFQNFSNKILILIDGRSVYNPLFSGVAYDAQDVRHGRHRSHRGHQRTRRHAVGRQCHERRHQHHHAQRAGHPGWLAARQRRRPGERAHRALWRIVRRRQCLSRLRQGIRSRSERTGERRERRRPLAQGAGRISHGSRRRSGRQSLHRAGRLPGRHRERRRAFGDVDFTQFDVLGRWEHAGERTNTRLQLYFDRTDRDQPPSGVGFTLQYLRHRFSADR